MNSSTLGILGLIIFLTVVTVAYIKLRHWQEGFEEQLEGFTDPTVAAIPPAANITPIQKNATFCPPGSKYFVNDNGDSLCCEHVPENRKCSKIVCTLSAPTGNIKSCNDIHNQLRDKLAATFCPPSMPNFFASEATGKKGCTSSAITTSGDGPLHPTSPKCVIGDEGPIADLLNKDSCLNTKRLEEMKCISPGCTKSFHAYKPDTPPVLTQTYTIVDENTPRVCTDDDSMQLYLDKVEPNWRNSNKAEYDFATNTQFCAAAKRILVEKRVA